MRCESFEEIVHDVTRGGADRDLVRDASAHAATCGRCAAKLREARALDADLRALELATAPVFPPSEIGERVRAALAERARGKHAPRRPAAWGWGLAAAAAITILALFGPQLKKSAKDPRIRPPSSRSASGPRVSDAAAGFVSLQYGDPMTDLGSFLIVRVELDPASMAGLGLAPGENGREGALEADLLLGEDGVARAIRFVD